ncbi:hypothetical protein [Streptomyces sp. NPDC006459]|uniref:SbtR family transcriptional regulator n=1 Tax=Streptomyces sp. NPDC006459 TaxID=3154303 RepID=UPI0033A8A00B
MARRVRRAGRHLPWAAGLADGHPRRSRLRPARLVPVHARGQRPRGACARGQDTGRIRPDVDGTVLFALVNAIGWIFDQAPSIAARRNHLLTLVMHGLASPGTGTGR